MNSKKNNVAPTSDDLQFIPLNLKEPFKSEDSSWAPCINIDVEADNVTNNFFIGLPDLKGNQGFTSLPAINPMPVLPYPIDTPKTPEPSKDTNNNISSIDELYPSELIKNELYSYNEDRDENSNIKNNYNRFSNNLIHLDILRDFDLSPDYDNSNTSRDYSNNEEVDKIFKNIEANHSGLISTLKTYRLPYPISTLLIKKIIKSTLDYSKKD